MKLKRWTMEVALQQNAVADGGLRAQMTYRPRELQRIAAGVRSPAVELLKFAYTIIPPEGRIPATVQQQLSAVLQYSSRPAHDLKMMPPPKALDLRPEEVRRVQTLTRKLLAQLWLAYSPDDAELGFPKVWCSPQIVTTLTYMRVGSYLLYDVERVKPRWMRHVLAVGTVLKDAVPWLRSCELCGRLFFKVKRQRLCALRRCKDVFQARQRGEKLRGQREHKGDKDERRGRPRKDYAAAIEKVHTEWIRMATEKRSKH